MMENFSHILQCLPIEKGTSSSIGHFGGTSPLKVQFNFDIPIFEGQIDVDALEKWLNILEGYLFVKNFPTRKRSPSHSSRLSPMSNIGGKLTRSKVPQMNMEYGAKPTWDFFVDAVKEQYYPVDNYEEQYMRWTTLWQEKIQTMP